MFYRLTYYIYICIFKLLKLTKLHKIGKIKGFNYKFFSRVEENVIKFSKVRKLKGNDDLIVSLTTFPKRVNKVNLTIKSILKQSHKPGMIILWLASEEFKNKNNSLPNKLLKLKKKGLVIKYCDNLMPHKKYYYTLKEYPNRNIITVDDDILYPPSTIKTLVKYSKKHRKNIICNRGHKITISSDNKVESYSKWISNYKTKSEPRFDICPTGIGAVFYPINSLDKRVLDKENIIKTCLRADDLWLKTMSLFANTKVVKTERFNYQFLSVLGTEKSGLVNKNVFENGNDNQFNAIYNQYKNEYDNIIKKHLN